MSDLMVGLQRESSNRLRDLKWRASAARRASPLRSCEALLWTATGCWPLAWRRKTKIHALADAKGRLIAILLTGGEAHDCPVAARLVNRVEPAERILGDKAYDSVELRDELHRRGTRPVIPNRSNRKQPFSFSKRLYKLRWRIETAFNRLKDFRRIATRYDRLARNYLASVCLAAALVWWI